VKDLLVKLTEAGDRRNRANNEYLQSLAYEYLSENGKAEKLEKWVLDKLYNVAMEACYESSFLPEKKSAIE
jgi:hypothetical protein